jgi:ferredoxin-thioredoxin reductase catalytic chain
MISIDKVRRRAESDAASFGYFLTPDADLLEGLLDGLKTNEERYGYPSCPCRLGSGKVEFDRDIICPCDYRDPDVADFGACYCRLYVNKAVFESKDLPMVPERRPLEKQLRAFQTASLAAERKPEAEEPKFDIGAKEEFVEGVVNKKKFWYCKQCGYVVFREDPPYICPICKAKREMFAEIKAQFDFTG